MGENVAHDEKQEEESASPFVIVDGQKYYANRFYINQVTRPENDVGRNAGQHDEGCITFSNGKFVEQLAKEGDLQACIFATYNLDLPDLEEEFPCLFPSSSCSSSSPAKGGQRMGPPIPTLILTGDNRIHRDYPLKQDGSADDYHVRKYIKQNASEPPHWNYERMDRNIQIQQVVCYFSNGVRTLGKFHPKFLLLCTSQLIYVIISTSNLDAQTTVDLSWVQSFPRRRPSHRSSNSSSSFTSGTSTNTTTAFGQGLDDVLKHVDESMSLWAGTQGRDQHPGIQLNSPLRFLKRVLGSPYLDRLYDFSTAAVDLITSVPYNEEIDGLAEGGGAATDQGKGGGNRRPLYGLHRMEELLLQYWSKDIPEYCKMAAMEDDTDENEPSAFPPPADRLRIQVTSISGPTGNDGDDPTPCDILTEALRLLLPDIEDQDRRHRRVELIWPTLQYIKECRRTRFKYRRDIKEERGVDYSKQNVGGSLFFIPTDCRNLSESWKNMRCFELHPAVAPATSPLLRSRETYQIERWKNVVPHLKTYSRALPGVRIRGSSKTEESDGSAGGEGGGGEALAWLWMTSANLSAGALGYFGVVKNFEMGVLFHSSTKKKVLYRAWPSSTSSPRSSTNEGLRVSGEWEDCRVIDLPLPYRLDAPMLADQSDPDDPSPDLVLPPFFHSHHDLMLTPRLPVLDPLIKKIFAQLQQDFQELEKTQGLNAEGWPIGNRAVLTHQQYQYSASNKKSSSSGKEGGGSISIHSNKRAKYSSP